MRARILLSSPLLLFAPAPGVAPLAATSPLSSSSRHQQHQQQQQQSAATADLLKRAAAATSLLSPSSTATTGRPRATFLSTTSSSSATVAEGLLDRGEEVQAAAEATENGEANNNNSNISSSGGGGSAMPPEGENAKEGTGATTTSVLADAPDFVKPERDGRHYRIVKLANNLVALLVSDGDVIQSNSGNSGSGESAGATGAAAAACVGAESASVHVQAGHFDDTVPGLAHFHEHMLFLGTEKYPDEKDYESFLSKYGGYANAYTDMEDTNYYFTVTTQADNVEGGGQVTSALKGGLDRLAQFFVRPTFDRDAVDRELRAIDSEYRNAKTSDGWRNFQLLKNSANPRHPFAKFGCGNYETLTSKGVDILLEELENFWRKYYTTSNIRLAVVGHANLDELQRAVEETFGALPYSDDPPRRVKSLPGQEFERENAVYADHGVPPAFSGGQLGLVREVVPFTETRAIKLYFSVPPLDDPLVRQTKPFRSISHVLGHESPGSLHSLLNDEGYIMGLSSGVGIDASDFSLFSLSIALTPKGMREKQKVLDLVFQWIALLRESESKLESYHEELRQLSSINFRFRENGDPTDFCSTASELLFDEGTPPRELLLGNSQVDDYDPQVAKAFLDRLKPDNCMITILNSDLKEEQEAAVAAAAAGDGKGESEWQTEPWYGATYRVKPIPEEQMRAWEFPTAVERDPRLRLPALNKYIPTDFSLRCDDDEPVVPAAGGATNGDTASSSSTDGSSDLVGTPPSLIIDTPSMRMWHKMDRYWRVPKTFVKVSLLSSKAYQTPRSMTLARIFQRVLQDDLNSFVYDAGMAGCGYRVSCTPFGYRISVRGYSEKLPFLLDTLTTRILSLIGEMQRGEPGPKERFDKAREGLLRETKNYRLDPPHEVANYNSRLLIEENVWYLDNYIQEMEGPLAERDPLTMEECADVARECFMGRVKCEALCMGNIDEKGCREVAGVLDRHFLNASRTLSEAETPRFRSLKLPTRDEAEVIFGKEVCQKRPFPLVYQDIAFSQTEENNAVEVILQVGCELDLGYEGVAILDLITHMAYNSAFSQLRTKEQLGYIVSAFSRKTTGSTWGMSVVVQGGVALPEVLEERCEAWLQTFRDELEAMPPASLAKEASAVVAQLLEKETKLSQEVTRMFGEILNTEGLSDQMRTPAFDRLEKIAEVLRIADDDVPDGDDGTTNRKAIRTPIELKDRVLSFFDKYFKPGSPHRRAMSARVYSQKSKSHYEDNIGQPGILSSHSEMRHYKLFLSSWPSVPYWRIDNGVPKFTPTTTTTAR